MIQSIFPTYFYSHFSLPNKKEVFKYLEDARVDKESTSNISWNKNCQVEVEQLYVNEFGPFLIPAAKIFLEEIGFKLNIELKSIWKNTYGKGSYQEIHDHLSEEMCEISGCIFLEDWEEGASKFFFYNRHSSEVSEKWKKIMRENDTSVYTYFLNPKGGDIIFFPSYMLHGVTSHQSESLRTTVSFNIKFL
tara:strand:+ start:274 stop:846 length:573 start_codon:yes stop_codon:yes gene_type:complete